MRLLALLFALCALAAISNAANAAPTLDWNVAQPPAAATGYAADSAGTPNSPRVSTPVIAEGCMP